MKLSKVILAEVATFFFINKKMQLYYSEWRALTSGLLISATMTQTHVTMVVSTKIEYGGTLYHEHLSMPMYCLKIDS